MITEILKVFIPAIVSFIIGIAITPILTDFLYSNKMWKKKAGKVTLDGNETPIFNSLHKEKEVGTPRMGGIIIWASVFITATLFWIIAEMFPNSSLVNFDFVSRSETWIPFSTLIIGALFGLVDDLLEVGVLSKENIGGLALRYRLIVIGALGLACGIWFYQKLGISTVSLPEGLHIQFGWFFPFFFMIVAAAVYSGGVIDGLDGLAGGVFAAIFTAYGSIAFIEYHYDLAAFCAATLGGILAFLWFNIPPARFYMSETGSMGLTITVSVIAFMTDSLSKGTGVMVLPIIAFPLVLASLSVIIQILSKKFRHGKKVFLVAPIHHHFEAQGWPSYKITMRFWIIALISAILGVAISIVR